jgi:hypothetical protein
MSLGPVKPQSLAALISSLFFSAGDYPFSARTRISVITDFSILAAMFCRPMTPITRDRGRRPNF